MIHRFKQHWMFLTCIPWTPFYRSIHWLQLDTSHGITAISYEYYSQFTSGKLCLLGKLFMSFRYCTAISVRLTSYYYSSFVIAALLEFNFLFTCQLFDLFSSQCVCGLTSSMCVVHNWDSMRNAVFLVLNGTYHRELWTL